MKFGEILKELRLSFNETQIDIGKVLGVSDRTIGLWERGERMPSIETVKTLAGHFNVSTDYLIGNINVSVLSDSNNDIFITKDDRYLELGRLLKKSTKKEQERFYKMAALLLEKHSNDRLFADAANGEDDDTI